MFEFREGCRSTLFVSTATEVVAQVGGFAGLRSPEAGEAEFSPVRPMFTSPQHCRRLWDSGFLCRREPRTFSDRGHHSPDFAEDREEFVRFSHSRHVNEKTDFHLSLTTSGLTFFRSGANSYVPEAPEYPICCIIPECFLV